MHKNQLKKKKKSQMPSSGIFKDSLRKPTYGKEF